MNIITRIPFLSTSLTLIRKPLLQQGKLQYFKYSTKIMAPVTGIHVNFDFRKATPECIEKATESLINSQRKVYDEVAAVAPDQINYENVIKRLSDTRCEWSTRSSFIDFPQHSSTDKSLRDASTAGEQKLEEFDVEMSMRKDVFDQITKFKETPEFGKLNPEQTRFVEKLIRQGKRNGLHLPEETRKEVQSIKNRISELGIKFSRNLNENNTKLYFSKEQLAGLPDDFINELNVGEDGKLEVTLKYPHLFPINKKCKVADTRKTMIASDHSQCMSENTPMLEELVEIRNKQAKLLGYKNHASFIHEERMAKTPDNVKTFLEDLGEKLQPLWKKEKEVMLEIKKEECEKLGCEFDGDINLWDVSYYCNKVEEIKYSVDHEELRKYFPMEKVTKGLLEIYQTLLGLKFTLEENADVWHEDVKLYRVNDAKTDELLGYFFLDLFPREGKYGHAAVFPMQPICIGPDGKRQVGVCAMMCNFTKPTKEKPSLLEHSEVVTFFHEFGHVMHGLCSYTDISMFAGTSVERDFVEAPSQMLENWCWEKEPLRMMSEHYETKEPIPDELLNKLYKSKEANAGAFNLRQIILATFDQKIHTSSSADTMNVFSDTYSGIMGIRPIPNTNMPAKFNHLAGGYDAQYYGYLWSEVFSMDMFDSCFKEKGIMNPDVGAAYRSKILKVGGSRDAMDSLKDFIGREPNNVAFLKSKGLKV